MSIPAVWNFNFESIWYDPCIFTYIYIYIYIYMFHAILFLFQHLGRIVFDGAPASFLGSLNLKPAWKSSKWNISISHGFSGSSKSNSSTEYHRWCMSSNLMWFRFGGCRQGAKSMVGTLYLLIVRSRIVVNWKVHEKLPQFRYYSPCMLLFHCFFSSSISRVERNPLSSAKTKKSHL